jgi:putative ATP-dependent endonuclease of the OLD family
VYIRELKIENFRGFGEGDSALVLPLTAGLTALVGENDVGKTAVVDALRLALGTRDQEFFRIEEADFHLPGDGSPRRKEIRICCKFEGLTGADKAAFTEFLTYEARGAVVEPVLYLHWKATNSTKPARLRSFTSVELRAGAKGDGPTFDPQCRALLCATYLRPLRDAERAMSAGRGSRLSQILQYTKEVRQHGQEYDPKQNPKPDPSTLSVLGIGDFVNALLDQHGGIKSARDNLNEHYLKHLCFTGDNVRGQIAVSGSQGDVEQRLRALLEKLDLTLMDTGDPTASRNHGLGSNNLLFMACELLLLGSENEGFPLLLIEEPEAHLHPQRQLRLMQFLREKAKQSRADQQSIQIIVTTHSPNLASVIDLNDLVLINKGRAFPLAHGYTELEKSDYGFLRRFLDVTKSNLFFARGLLIVEGDAENILLPTLARLIGRDLTENGVSIVNVGGIGLRRFARIFQRKIPFAGLHIDIPVACVTDMDVMPDCAPVILGKLNENDAWPPLSPRKWRAKRDFDETGLKTKREEIRSKASGQRVETFVTDEWTLEYDLAYFGLAKEVWIAASLAKADERINAQLVTEADVVKEATQKFAELEAENLPREELASWIYSRFVGDSGVSKAVAAQYLAARMEAGGHSSQDLQTMLPPYLLAAIKHVTTGARHSAGRVGK